MSLLLSHGSDVLTIVILVIVSALLYLYNWAAPKGYPLQKEIEGLLLPYAYEAILAAYKMSEIEFDKFKRPLSGEQKAYLAKKMYDLLPDKIGPYNKGTITGLVPVDVWERLIQEMFDQAMTKVYDNLDKLEEIAADKFHEMG